ncbi:glycosyltransferase [Mycoplasma mycoides subsp. capri]|nr:glycosyltransferase [Mycoplasma mycoides subsp. capri]
MKKHSYLYKWILIIWFIISLSITIPLVFKFIHLFNVDDSHSLTTKIIIAVLLTINGTIFCLFWLKSTRDLIFSLFFIIKKKSLLKLYHPVIKTKLRENFLSKKVVVLYCTCDDFSKDALLRSMNQDYKNYEIVILDDSKKLEQIKEIDEFSNQYNIKVIRRTNRIGYKAGNLNNYLKNNPDYDYFVVLDSDEIIPQNFITESLKYFQFDEKIGAVQAYHAASKGKNLFQYLLGDSNNNTALSFHIMRDIFGETSLLGHGMILSKQAYEKTGGFPHLLVEDTSMSAELKKQGFKIAYASNILCYEDFPTNYIALKKRQSRWTAGNVQYIRKYGKQNKKIDYKWFERIDLLLNHYSLPLVPIFGFIFLINFIILGFLDFQARFYETAFIIIWILFLLSPILVNAIHHSKNKKIIWIIPNFIATIATYTSLTITLLLSVLLALFNRKPKFIVTPKTNTKISLKYIIFHSLIPILFGAVVILLTYFSWDSVLPTLVISLPCLLTPFIILFSNFKINAK